MKQKITFEDVINTELIKKYMKDNNLSKREFARKCNLNVWNLDAVLQGRNCRVVYFAKIAKAMNVQLKDLFLQKNNQ